jgi:subtilisin family serine protease
MSDQFAILEQRLSALERQNRRLKTWLGGVFVLSLVPFALGAAAQTNADVLRATKFEVVKDGKTVASLAALADGGSLDIYDAAGNRAAYLASTKNGGSLDISKKGMTVGYFDARESGGAILCVQNNIEKCVVTIRPTTTNQGEIVVSTGDSDNRSIFTAP